MPPHVQSNDYGNHSFGGNFNHHNEPHHEEMGENQRASVREEEKLNEDIASQAGK